MNTQFCSENLKEKQLWRPRRRWEDNIRMDLREMGWNGVDWMHLARTGTSGGLLWTR